MNYTKTLLNIFLIIVSIFNLSACTDAGDLLSLAFNPPSRKPIDKSLVGVNNFFVDTNEFGSISSQYSDIKNNLGLKFIRVLFAWTDDVQPSPNSSLNYSFYDSILENVPPGVDVLIVLSHSPSWITSSSGSEARTLWIENWLKPTVARYKNNGSVVGFEIFNEPDVLTLPQDNALGVSEPSGYFDLLSRSYIAGKKIAPSKRFIMAATTSIQRQFPKVLQYNKTLRDLGADAYTDVWNIHYYATSYESVVTSNGVADFLNGISKPVWVTESGETGPNKQLAYVETAWPFLKSKIGGIERFYYYQYGETGPIENNFGLRTTDSNFPVSDLYLFLKNGTR